MGSGGNQADLSFARSVVAPHWVARDRGFAGPAWVPRARARRRREGERRRVARGSGADSNFLAEAEIRRAIGILPDESARRT